MNISQKSCFRNKIKKSTGQLSCRAFQLSSSEHSWWISHIDLFCFFKLQDMDSSSYSFMAMYDKRLGLRIKQRTPNTAQCLNFIDVILQIPICYRRRNRKGNTNIKIHVQDFFSELFFLDNGLKSQQGTIQRFWNKIKFEGFTIDFKGNKWLLWSRCLELDKTKRPEV